MTDPEFLRYLADKIERLPTMFDKEERERLRTIALTLSPEQTSWDERNKFALSQVFSMDQWRVIAVACGRVPRSVFIHEEHYTEARSIAMQIARETGKMNR